jgi:hypothetical protein
MNAYVQVRRFRGHESHWSEFLKDEQPEESVEVSQANHSRDNIARWSTYLPADCIRTMVDMGWDRST